MVYESDSILQGAGFKEKDKGDKVTSNLGED
jgi:hypothetical protein